MRNYILFKNYHYTLLCFNLLPIYPLDGGRILNCIINYLLPYKKGNKLSKDEAIYLTGILNLSIINQYFKATYSERSYSINFDIRIPKFKDDNSIQKEMVRITKQLLVNPSNEELLNNLEDEYIKLLKDEKKGTSHFE